MIPTFNCAHYLEKTLLSVLEEDRGSDLMQIEVVDDVSNKDSPSNVVDRIGNGRVQFYQQQKNVGAISNFNTCIERAKGEFIHILHGDDWVQNGFYEHVERCFAEYPQIGIVIKGTSIVNADGDHIEYSPPINSLKFPNSDITELIYFNRIRTPSVVVRKSAYLKVGRFNPKFNHVADWEMWVRLIKSEQGIYIDKPLANYRSFENNDSSKMHRSGKNILFTEILYKHFAESNILKFDAHLKNVLFKHALDQSNFYYKKNKPLYFFQNYKILFRYITNRGKIKHIIRMSYKILVIWIKIFTNRHT